MLIDPDVFVLFSCMRLWVFARAFSVCVVLNRSIPVTALRRGYAFAIPLIPERRDSWNCWRCRNSSVAVPGWCRRQPMIVKSIWGKNHCHHHKDMISYVLYTPAQYSLLIRESRRIYHIIHSQDHPHNLSGQQELLPLRDERIVHELSLHVCGLTEHSMISVQGQTVNRRPFTDRSLHDPYNLSPIADCFPSLVDS